MTTDLQVLILMIFAFINLSLLGAAYITERRRYFILLVLSFTITVIFGLVAIFNN